MPIQPASLLDPAAKALETLFWGLPAQITHTFNCHEGGRNQIREPGGLILINPEVDENGCGLFTILEDDELLYLWFCFHWRQDF